MNAQTSDELSNMSLNFDRLDVRLYIDHDELRRPTLRRTMSLPSSLQMLQDQLRLYEDFSEYEGDSETGESPTPLSSENDENFNITLPPLKHLALDSRVPGPAVAPTIQLDIRLSRHAGLPPRSNLPTPTYPSPVEARRARDRMLDTYRPNFWLWVVWKKRPQFRVEFRRRANPLQPLSGSIDEDAAGVREAGGENLFDHRRWKCVSRRIPGFRLSSPLAPGRFIGGSPAPKVSKRNAVEPVRSAHDCVSDDFMVDGEESPRRILPDLAVFCISLAVVLISLGSLLLDGSYI
jgi:hypothetical protein